MGSAAYAWQQLKTNEAFLYATLKTATSFVDDAVTQAERYGVPRTATLSLLTRAEGLFDNMAMLGKPKPPELRYQKAWMLIQFARNYQAPRRHDQMARARRGRATTAPDPLRRRPTPGNAGWQRDLAVSFNKLGNAEKAQGRLEDALNSYEQGRAIMERLAKDDPSNAGWQRDVSVSDIEIGNVALAQGDAEKALKSYQDSLAIRDRLAKSDPNNADWQRDLAIAHGRVGLALVQRGKMDEAFAELREGRELVASLKEKSSSSAALAQDLIWFDKTLAGLEEAVSPAPQEGEAEPALH